MVLTYAVRLGEGGGGSLVNCSRSASRICVVRFCFPKTMRFSTLCIAIDGRTTPCVGCSSSFMMDESHTNSKYGVLEYILYKKTVRKRSPSENKDGALREHTRRGDRGEIARAEPTMASLAAQLAESKRSLSELVDEVLYCEGEIEKYKKQAVYLQQGLSDFQRVNNFP